jgi:transcriptional repressor NrdR
MVCIYCSSKTRVTNSRRQARTRSVWRRRSCLACGGIFTTIESVDFATSLLVHKSDKTTPAPFSRDILFASILASCNHRPAAIHDASALTDTIIKKVLQRGQADITLSELTNLTHDVLTRFDAFAATYYKNYSVKQ